MRRRRFWHVLADLGAPHWLWARFIRATWRPCSTCDWRGVGRWKCAYTFGGGLPERRYCSHACARASDVPW